MYNQSSNYVIFFFLDSLFLLFWCRNDGADPLAWLVSRLVRTSLRRARIWANGVTISSSSSTFLKNGHKCLFLILFRYHNCTVNYIFKKLTRETPEIDAECHWWLWSCCGGRTPSWAFHQPWGILMTHLWTCHYGLQLYDNFYLIYVVAWITTQMWETPMSTYRNKCGVSRFSQFSIAGDSVL